MNSRTQKRVIRCPSRKRAVEVEYSISGTWLAPRYEITDCPAMYDGIETCNRQCLCLLSRPPTAFRGIIGLPPGIG